MNSDIIIEAVTKARKRFGIKQFPGNLFDFFEKSNFDYISKYKFIIFKEDLDKLSGFISYEKSYAFIGINYKRPIGHQNLTLAHELGHMLLHVSNSFSDVDCMGKSMKEKEAFNFGMELLYPEKLFKEDNNYIQENALLNINKYKELAMFIDELCHKYFLSFDAILRRIAYFNFKKSSGIKTMKKNINKAMGKEYDNKYTHLDKNFHISDGSSYSVKDEEPYKRLTKLVEIADGNKLISPATAESILLSQDLLGDD